jgi:hypothetical protein
MDGFIWFVILVFQLASGEPGVHTSLLRNPNDCDKAAAAMIERDLKDYPDAEDFGWVCTPLQMEGYPPALFGKLLPEDHPAIDAPPLVKE